VESNPLEWLRNRTAVRIPQFDAAAFQRATHLPSSWLPACHALLMDKPQLILHGVPGTGKTHIALALARRLTDDRPGAIRLVQFHPAYNYEEFVEGIRAKTIEVNGRNEVSYPVEEGVLLTFAAEAQAEPEHTFVLLIDEINRGNLPRILGELFYSLEYRDQPVTLPYSRRQFQLPPNLWIIGTMNGQDRSIVALDGALRRRFNFVEMVPDAALLARWLMAYPPQEDEPFAAQVVAMFERINAQLAEDLGATQQIGHSYWMQRDLTEEMLHRVWDHQIHPQIRDMLGLQPARLTRYTWEQVWNPTPRRRRVES